jgi:hypothetical protein
MKALVYLITDGIYTKIGKGNDPEKRVIDLQRGSPNKLSVLGTLEYPTDAEALAAEYKLQQTYKHQQVLGEWFLLTTYEIAKILNGRSDMFHRVITKDTEIATFLKEQIASGIALKDIRKNKQEIFVTNCIECNTLLELRYFNLIANIHNKCKDCILKEKDIKSRTIMQNKQDRKNNSFLRKYYKHTARKMNTVRYDYSPNITIIFDNIVASCPEHGPFMINAIERTLSKVSTTTKNSKIYLRNYNRRTA